jgi:copper chaperone
MVTETIAVTGMSCGGCEQRVHDAVMALPGAVSATAEHIGDEVEVTFDPARLNVKAIRSAIAAAGYRPRP